MTRKTLIVLVVSALICSAAAAADTERLLAMAAKQTDGALAVLSFKLTHELGTRPMSGEAICIDPSGLFVSFLFSSTMRAEDLSDFELLTLGLGGQTFKAKLVGIDPEIGMGFVQALGGQWKALSFAQKANLYIGQEVVSVGVMPPETGYTRYFGSAYVSALIRVPERQVYVTGGTLTSVGSPVLASDGRVVGIVHRQLPLSQDFIQTDRGRVAVRKAGEHEAAFFMPVDEFHHVIANAGKERKLSWTGIIRFKPLGEDLSGIMKLDRPGVMIDKIAPGTPADQAKLQSRDVIVSVNGQSIEELGAPMLTARNLERTLTRMPVGSQVQLSVFREGKVMEVTLTTAEMPTMPYQAQRYYSTALGLGVRQRIAIDDYLEDSGIAKVPGVIVYLVVPNSPAAGARVQENDVLSTVAGAAVTTIDAFKNIEKRILDDKALKEVELEVARGDAKEKLRLRLPGR